MAFNLTGAVRGTFAGGPSLQGLSALWPQLLNLGGVVTLDPESKINQVLQRIEMEVFKPICPDPKYLY